MSPIGEQAGNPMAAAKGGIGEQAPPPPKNTGKNKAAKKPAKRKPIVRKAAKKPAKKAAKKNKR